MSVSVIINVTALYEIVPTVNLNGQLAALDALHLKNAGRAARLGGAGINGRLTRLLDGTDPVHLQLERTHLLI